MGFTTEPFLQAHAPPTNLFCSTQLLPSPALGVAGKKYLCGWFPGALRRAPSSGKGFQSCSETGF